MTKIIVQNPTRPLLLLSPDESRDRNGPVTPTIAGGVIEVPGQYGNAWDTTDGNISINISSPQSGTLILRLRRSGAPFINNEIFLTLGASTATRIQTYMTSSRGVSISYPGGSQVSGGPVFDHANWDYFDVSWNATNVRSKRLGVNETTSAAIEAGRIALSSGVGYRWQGLIESVLVYDTALTDEEIQRITTMPEAWAWQNASLTERMVDAEIEVAVPKGKSGLNIIETKVYESDMFGTTGREIPVTNAKMTSDIDRAGSKTRVELETVYLNPEYQYSIGPGRWVSMFQEIARENEGIERVQRGVFELGQPTVLSKGQRDSVHNSGNDVVDRLARASVLDTFYTPIGGYIMGDTELAIRMLGITSMGPNIVETGGFEGDSFWSTGHSGGGSSTRERIGEYTYGSYGLIVPPEGEMMESVLFPASTPQGGGRFWYANRPIPDGARAMYASVLMFRGGRADQFKIGINFRKDGAMTEVAADTRTLSNSIGAWTRFFVVADVPDWGTEAQVSFSVTYDGEPSPTWAERYFIDDVRVGVCTGDLLPESILALPSGATKASNRIQHLPGATLLSAVNDRLTAIGMMAVHATPDSKFTSRPSRDTATDATVRTFHLNHDVRMIGDVTIERSVTSMYNRVFAIKEDFTTGESMIAIAENDNVSDPWSIHNILLEPKIVTSQDAADLQVLQDLADAELARASMQTSIKFGILPDPALTVYDMIYIEGPPGHRATGRWAIESIESGLTTDNPLMIIGARRSTR